MNEFHLPIVSGKLDRTLAALERGALVCLMHEQMRLAPDNALIAVLCDTVRLCRESGPNPGLIQTPEERLRDEEYV